MAPILSSSQVQQLDKSSLFEFLALKMIEGSQIDYKEDLSAESKYERYKEFLKDITAFANAHGGILLLGIKEPSDDVTSEIQAVGIFDGDKIAKDLERVAATSVDPRIPGLLIKSINIQGDKYAIVMYIPASLIRPHMVNYQKHRCFYIRHSESSVPMTTHEIRDTVLSSATSEGRARSYAQDEEYEALEYIIAEQPAFLIQAVPLLLLESPWEVLTPFIINIVRGEGRDRVYNYNRFDLKSLSSPTPTLKGIMGRESRENTTWLTEIHRSGFIQAIYLDIPKKPNDPAKFALHEAYADLFQAFCDLCETLWKATQTDVPYLFKCSYYNAEQTYMDTKTRYGYRGLTNVYGKRQISLPERIRQTGEPLNEIPKIWIERLHNAFGLNWKMPDNPSL